MNKTSKFSRKRADTCNTNALQAKPVAIQCGEKKADVLMAQITLRIDDDVKRNAEQVCADIGMPLSTAINIYLKNLEKKDVSLKKDDKYHSTQ